MQFKYPELLWGLLLLVIPIIIHLFQLRRFKKTPFTNVKFLKLVVSESRKSSSLKKWLLLFTRMLLLAALVIAFAQPFIANTSATQEKQTVFYLDDSFSMGHTTNGSSTFQNLVQEFIQTLPQGQKFSLFTNNKTYKDVEITDIQNKLLNIKLSAKQLNLQQITLKGNSLFPNHDNIQKNLVLISDFQKRFGEVEKDTLSKVNIHYIQPNIEEFENGSIDSVYIGNASSENIEVIALLSNNRSVENMPISLYNDTILVAKTSAKFHNTKTAKVSFTINAKEPLLGKITLADNGLKYDNQFYFNIDKKPKIKVLAIGHEKDSFLNRIYTDNEFTYKNVQLEQLNYGTIDNQDLVVLNELDNIPIALATAIQQFITNGGSLVLIPSLNADVSSYNNLVSKYKNTKFSNTSTQKMPISNINIEHPIFKNVFDENVKDFQFPTVDQFYTIKTKANTAIEFQNKRPFLVGTDQVYIFTAALTQNNSNFKSSPLIVPTFYNIGTSSLKLPSLYTVLGTKSTIEVPINLQEDDIISIGNNTQEFIPKQKVLSKKVAITFTENPNTDGIFTIKQGEHKISHISFNHNREESELLYLELPKEHTNTSLTSFFYAYQKSNAINEFWKWFAILAFLFVLVETLLQKFIK